MLRNHTLIKAGFAAAAAILTGLMLNQCSQPKAAHGYQVALSFTPAAAAQLKALGKQVVVDGYYYADPVPASADRVDDTGHINMGEDQVMVEGHDQTVVMTGNGLAPDMKGRIKDGTLSVTVRAYLDPAAGMANILTCNQYDGLLSGAQAKPVTIQCDLKK
ncbi:hypothetical protein [Asticcacaulis sp. EMRT-3]|uniref:hypothetical protein n=1 Tax=Asticcacaulis sp. EMRT-3 TaxID=3040349 RepID=UPI0024AEDF74|nr:hypothetical protein [Asticcacaulis sp. EMRT-3]MDI7775700.1 hypothetical protein [Asticcacaulis sp. EMRT-3]